mmetsp:Transcript_22996/g.58398  ORF Transcript_22996/g.58398 Transcript_22996/m.58398 type:complete len:327 (+) Transcript_22996:575-1555(+)
MAASGLGPTYSSSSAAAVADFCSRQKLCFHSASTFAAPSSVLPSPSESSSSDSLGEAPCFATSAKGAKATFLPLTETTPPIAGRSGAIGTASITATPASAAGTPGSAAGAACGSESPSRRLFLKLAASGISSPVERGSARGTGSSARARFLSSVSSLQSALPCFLTFFFNAANRFFSSFAAFFSLAALRLRRRRRSALESVELLLPLPLLLLLPSPPSRLLTAGFATCSFSGASLPNSSISSLPPAPPFAPARARGSHSGEGEFVQIWRCLFLRSRSRSAYRLSIHAWKSEASGCIPCPPPPPPLPPPPPPPLPPPIAEWNAFTSR